MNEKLRQIASRHLTISYDEDSQMEEFSNDALIVLDGLLNDVIKECTDILRDTFDCHFEAEQIEEHFGVNDE